jgi:hypothetical protein
MSLNGPQVPQEYVARLARLAPQLDAIRRAEQAALTPAEHLAAVASVLALADPRSGESMTSGLVEFQRRLAPLRPKA